MPGVEPQYRVEPSIGATTVIDFPQRARLADMSWPPPEDMTDEALEARLFPAALPEIKAPRPQSDWRAIHRELRRKGVTLQLLCEEHRAAHPNGFGLQE
jgi:transposase